MASEHRRSLTDQIVVISGASRGIGRDMAVRVAADGARVALLAKTETPHPKIAGTLGETARAVEEAGGVALPVACDVRDPAAVDAAIAKVVEEFGGIDVVVHNAGAIDLKSTAALSPKSFDKLLAINTRGAFHVVHAALPHLSRSKNAHIVNVSPPLDLDPVWFADNVGHTVGKYAESLLTFGWAAEFATIPIAVNSLWPATFVASTGMMVAMGEDAMRAQSRTTQIMADALYALVTRPAAECTGHFYTDEDVLREEGVDDFSSYRLAEREEDLKRNFYVSAAVRTS